MKFQGLHFKMLYGMGFISQQYQYWIVYYTSYMHTNIEEISCKMLKWIKMCWEKIFIRYNNSFIRTRRRNDLLNDLLNFGSVPWHNPNSIQTLAMVLILVSIRIQFASKIKTQLTPFYFVKNVSTVISAAWDESETLKTFEFFRNTGRLKFVDSPSIIYY